MSNPSGGSSGTASCAGKSIYPANAPSGGSGIARKQVPAPINQPIVNGMVACNDCTKYPNYKSYQDGADCTTLATSEQDKCKAYQECVSNVAKQLTKQQGKDDVAKVLIYGAIFLVIMILVFVIIWAATRVKKPKAPVSV